ncbi:hypothetical protein [Streptomyces sp. NPDC003877]
MTTDHTPPAEQAAELTAEEARALADDLGLKLYRAEDALAFVAECCDIADREQRPITTTQVREWLKGARCGRQLLADAADRAELRDRIADVLAAADGWKWAPGFKAESPTWHDYQARADAVLAVLPPPVSRADVLPAWEAVYEPGNVSDYLIGYANHQDAATGMAEAWMRSQAEVTGRLEWVDDEQLATGNYDRWFELIERHGGGVDIGTGIVVRRMADEAQPECSASRSGHCLREAESETACDTEAGECVHGERAAAEAQPAEPPLDVRAAREALYTAATGSGRMPETDAAQHLATLTRAAAGAQQDGVAS